MHTIYFNWSSCTQSHLIRRIHIFTWTIIQIHQQRNAANGKTLNRCQRRKVFMFTFIVPQLSIHFAYVLENTVIYNSHDRDGTDVGIPGTMTHTLVRIGLATKFIPVKAIYICEYISFRLFLPMDFCLCRHSCSSHSNFNNFFSMQYGTYITWVYTILGIRYHVQRWTWDLMRMLALSSFPSA